MNKLELYSYKNYLDEAEVIKLKGILKDNCDIILRTLKLDRGFPKIKCFLYPSVEIKEKETGEDANAHTDRDKLELYLVYNDIIKPTGPHEFVHLLTSHISVPNYFFCEGLAEYFEDFWTAEIDGKMETLEHDVWVKKFLLDNTYISIADLFDDSKFWELDDSGAFSYPESGSYMKYLVGRHGIEKVTLAYSRLKRNSPDALQNYRVFESIFGVKLWESEKDWLASLD